MSKRRLRLALAFGLVALLVAVPAALGGSAASSGSVSASLAEGTDLWFVELGGTPASFRAKAKAAGIQYSERYAFTKLWNGVSVKAGPGAIKDIQTLSGVKAVYPVLKFDLVPTPTISPELATALAMTGADRAQSELGYTGAGVKVAVMDTGVDYDHADLGGDGVQRSNSAVFPTSRVIAGWDFVGDDFNAADPAHHETNPDELPDDCQGHGTHVSGIVGANGGAVGVAPDVQFGAYRVFGCEGSTFADIMLAAMERALADDMDILNMSIGSAFQTWPQYPTAAGSDALVEEGVVVVASIGNSGANGVYSAGAPGVGRNVIGVASFDNSHINALTFDVNPSGQKVAYLPLATTPDPPTSGDSDEVVFVGRGCPGDALTPPGDDDPYLADPAGKVALIIRGDCTFQSKYQRAADAGATAVVIHNQFEGLFAGGGVTPRDDIPGVGISRADGLHIRSLLDAGETVTLTWTDERINAVNPTGGLASSFTSYGQTAELDLKPDIGAPGGLIRSTYPLEKGAYATISGTSMSSPHVAGTAALLMQAKPGLATKDFRTALQNSAEPALWWGNPGLGLLEPTHRQGAGMVQIDRSILATTTVSPGKWAINFLNPGPVTMATQTLTLTNGGSEDVTYEVSHDTHPSFGTSRTISTGGSTNSPGFFLGNQTVTLSTSSVTVPAGGSATVDATVSTPSAPFGRQYGGYIVFTPEGEGTPLRVPYSGFQGNYLDIRVLVPTANEFPWLTKLQEGSFVKQEDGAVYTMEGGDTPWVIAHFEHQSRQMQLVLLDAATGEPVKARGRAISWNATLQQLEFLPRNSTATSFFAFAWDGLIVQSTRGATVRRPVPDGQYKLQLRVLKALGDPAIPAHTEVWDSPTFVIDRP